MKRILTITFIATISLIAVILFNNNWSFKQKPNRTVDVSTDSIIQPRLQYGLPIDSFNIETFTVKRNQTLGNIMIEHRVSGAIVNQLPSKTNGIFDIRKIRAGNEYKVFSSLDTNQTAQYMVYEHSQVEYVVFKLTDSLLVSVGEREIIPVPQISEAEITSSLWEAMSSHNINPTLALELSDIFAWAVDFFGLYQGDKFKAIYDELYVDDNSIGVGTVHAAWFEHRGQKYYAFRYMQDSVWSYWDEQGNSLRKAFLKAPLRFSRISSGFSYSRMHPILKIRRPHTGVDYAAPTGTPVVALGDGVVIAKGYNKSAGNFVKIKHNSVYSTAYYHFSRFGKGISKGARVQQGQVIGYVGATGLATGPHLDFRFWKNGKPMDPTKVEAPPVEPIKDELRASFLKNIAPLKVKLDSISLKPNFPENYANSSF